MRSRWFSGQFCVHKLIEILLVLLVVSPAYSGWQLPLGAYPAGTVPATTLASGETNPSTPEYKITGKTVPAVEAVKITLSGVVTSRRITVLAGQTALLPCVVGKLQDKVVSWIRTRDLHILTSGIFTFTSDNRFEVVHKPDIDYWGLKIKNTLTSDSGKYECQVNTDPKMNFPIILTVTDSHMHDSPMDEGSRGWSEVQTGGVATIHGPREQHVRAGSTITFTCVVSRTERPNASRFLLKWTHAGRDVTFQSSRGGISMDTDYREEVVTSRLTVAMVTQEDAGDYTCEDFDVTPATVTLQVFEGERSEAMLSSRGKEGFQVSASATFSCFYYPCLPFFFVYFNCVLR